MLLKRIEIVPFEDEAFVVAPVAVAPGTGVLFHLNATARAILELLQAGASFEEVAQTVADAGSVSLSRVIRDIQALVDKLDYGMNQGQAADGASQSPPLPAPPLQRLNTAANYRLFGHAVLVHFPNADVAATCCPLLAPMEAPPDAPNDHRVTFQEVGEEYVVTCGMATVSVPRTAWSAFIAMQRVVLCHDKPDPGLFQVVLHAGAVVGRKGAWLIGGASGHGKSTLVARLDAKGLRVLGDDLVPLVLKDKRAFPLSMPLSIKNSGWSVVHTFRPDLLNAQPLITPIGKNVRYVAPINGPQDEDRQGHPVAGVLLPNRSTGATPTVRPISLKRAMVGLCDEFGRFPIEPEELRSLISMIAGIPRYELVYDNVEDVLPELSRLL